MITIFANSTKVQLPVTKGMVVAPKRHRVQLQAISGGFIHQVIGSLSATSGAPQWQGELSETDLAALTAMHEASATCHLTVDDKCYRCVWSVLPDVRNGAKRPTTITFNVVEDVTPC